MRCARLWVLLSIVVGFVGGGIGLDASAAGLRATSGRLIDLPLLFAVPEDGSVVFLVAPELGATEIRFRDRTIVVPVAGRFLKTRGPFAIAAGTDRLVVTVGEYLPNDYDTSLFVTAVFVPTNGESSPYVIAAPVWVPIVTRVSHVVDQEDSPALTLPGRGFRVLAFRQGDDAAPAMAVNRRGGRRGR